MYSSEHPGIFEMGELDRTLISVNYHVQLRTKISKSDNKLRRQSTSDRNYRFNFSNRNVIDMQYNLKIRHVKKI